MFFLIFLFLFELTQLRVRICVAVRIPMAAAVTKRDCWSQELIKGFMKWRGEHFPTGTKWHVRKFWKVDLWRKIVTCWIIIKWLIFHDSMKMQFWFPTTQISTLKSKWTKYVLGSWGNPGGPLHYLETNIRRSTIVKGKKQTLQWGESCERGESSKRTFLQRLQSFSPRWQGQGGNWPTQHHATKHGFHHSSNLSTSITHNPVPGDGFAKTATSDVLDHEARHWIFGCKSLGGNHQSPRGRTRSWRNAGKEDWDGLQPLSSRPFQLEIHGKCSWRFTWNTYPPSHAPWPK